MPSPPSDTNTNDDGTISANSCFYRPYRSKRRRPCDVCRRRKTACRIESQPPCASCRDLRVECRFEGPPVRRRSRPVPVQPPLDIPDEIHVSLSQDLNSSAFPNGSDEDARDIPVTRQEDTPVMAWNPGDSMDGQPLAPDLLEAVPQMASWLTMLGDAADDRMDLTWQEYPINEMVPNHRHRTESSSGMAVTPSTVIKSLDDMPGFTAQYLGLSGETDPYLIRHFHFASEGEARFFKVHFRQVASEGNGITLDGVPAHFMISSEELGKTMKPETTLHDPSESMGTKLNDMINPNDGRRLVRLFLRFIFPSFPILSRSQLGLGHETQYPDTEALSKIPCHLLAAIYAISIQFCHHDPVLCVSKVYTKPAVDGLWKIALQEIMREIHTPRLSVLQAILIYLQKPQTDETSAMADSPFHWSMMGFANSLACNLGLHLECRQWSIPDWEKRLRRRLWWAVFSEVAWRSLLLGFANPIHQDQWDVGELDEMDFVIDEPLIEISTTPKERDVLEATPTQCDFIHLVQLARIATGIYWTFYTLKASKQLATDFDLSLQAARPFRTQLTDWYSALPRHYQILQVSDAPMTRHRRGPNTAAYLQLSYLTLELLIYRALIRPTGGVVPKEASEPRDEAQNQDADAQSPLENQPHPALDAVLNAAEDCARLITTCTSDLTSRDLSSFWFSWLRVCFSTMSNFAVMLLIQAPSLARAQEAKRIVDEWRETLRMHSQTFSLAGGLDNMIKATPVQPQTPHEIYPFAHQASTMTQIDAPYACIVLNGTVVTAVDIACYDIAIKDGKIAMLAPALSLRDMPARRIIDAEGAYVMPGGVDAHVHLAEPELFGKGKSADDFESGSRSAVAGGTTTIIAFAPQVKTDPSVLGSLEEAQGKAANKTYCDYSLHIIVANPGPQALKEFSILRERGVSSVKIYMTYEALQLRDNQILDVLLQARTDGITTMIHAENGDMLNWMTDQLEKRLLLAPKYHATSRPQLVESEATNRAIVLGQLIGAPILIVHVSSPVATEAIRRAQDHGLPVYAETCPQYLFLTSQDLDQPGFEGAKCVCSPPPRHGVQDLEGIWRGLQNGTFTILSSDHCPFLYDNKDIGKKSAIEEDAPLGRFRYIPNGCPGVETRLPLVLSEKRLTPQRFVELTSTNPAKLYGLYPKKGALIPGVSDGDLVIWYPSLEPFQITNSDLHHNVDYTPYEGRTVSQWPRYTIIRGEVVWDRDNGGVVGQKGYGQFVHRTRSHFGEDLPAWDVEKF
ncbi:hypothetical protein FDECE_8820 [Fusarium decemcellulare]|nr:hypothetical protein FDECE_8820 [Fusarium decemcellulare]